jgi:hypothetical protein
MAAVNNETALEEIKRRRDEWERRSAEDERNGMKFSSVMGVGVVNGLELAIEILESKGE